MEKNLYEILDIEQTCTPEEVKSAYRRAAKLYHPDITGGKYGEMWHDIQEAYFILIDPEKRKRYDDTGFIPQSDNKLQQSVYNFIRDHLTVYMNQTDSVFDIDIIQSIINSCDANTINCQRNIQMSKNKLQFLYRFKKKFKKKHHIETDVINIIFIEEETNLNNAIRQFYHDIDVCRATKNILLNYEFDLTKYISESV